jgi:hypothetical protein
VNDSAEILRFASGLGRVRARYVAAFRKRINRDFVASPSEVIS